MQTPKPTPRSWSVSAALIVGLLVCLVLAQSSLAGSTMPDNSPLSPHPRPLSQRDQRGQTGQKGQRERLSPLARLLPLPPIIFVARNHLATLDNVHVGPPLDILGRERFVGGRLMLRQPDGGLVELTAGTPIIDAQHPSVSFDAQTVVFSGLKSPRGQWYIYKINLDGTGFQQLTSDDRDFLIPDDPREPGRNQAIFGRYGDFDPVFLPDGRVMFASTRYPSLSASCGQRGQNLYVMNADGSHQYRVTTVRAGAMDPWVLANGRVMYSFWVDSMNEPNPLGPGLRPLETEYNFMPSFWGLWSIRPDGSDNGRFAFLRGGLSDSGGALNARELPDGDIVFTYRTRASLLDDTLPSGVARLTPGLVAPHPIQTIGDPANRAGPHALGPAPLPDGRVVLSYTPTSTVQMDPFGRTVAEYDYGLYLVDMDTLVPELIYNDPATDELEPVAVVTRTAEILPDIPEADWVTDDPMVNLGHTAFLFNHNVYADLPLDVVDLPSSAAGTVKWVEVWDDTQTFTTTEESPLVRKQMPRFLSRAEVSPTGVFSVEVPADRVLTYVLVNAGGVAVRTLRSPVSISDRGETITHIFAHDYLRPNQTFHCTGCHRGHMIRPDLSMVAQANLARLATATASSEAKSFPVGAWRVNDLRRADSQGQFAWVAAAGDPAPWIRLDWPAPVTITQVILHPLIVQGSQVTAATLSFSDGLTLPTGPLPADGSPLTVTVGLSGITWARFSIDAAVGPARGLAEWVVNGPPDVALPDVAPSPPTNLATTQGVLYLTWDRNPDPTVAGYKVYYGVTPGGEYTGTFDVGNVNRVMLRDLAPGQTYYLALKAYNTYGTESLTFSNQVSGTQVTPFINSIEPDHGPANGGTRVVIHGSNFAPRGVQVIIGGDHAYDVVVSDTQTITATTHWHGAGPADVEVMNPDDQKAILPAGFTYYRPLVGDTNGDCVVDATDLMRAAARWGAVKGIEGYSLTYDMDFDDDIDVVDVMEFARRWGESCE